MNETPQYEDAPRVLAINISPEKGAPMQSIDAAEITESGIAGDRYEAGKGAWSKVRNVVRHISLIESEAIGKANQEFDIDTMFSDTRRNVLTIGIPLNDLVGKQFSIGGVVVEGVELCEPCGRPGILSKRDGLKLKFEEAFKGRGGLRVKVIKTGTIRAGDEIRVDA